MPLPWPEIRDKAIAFSREWRDAESERAEARPHRRLLDAPYCALPEVHKSVTRSVESAKSPAKKKKSLKSIFYSAICSGQKKRVQ